MEKSLPFSKIKLINREKKVNFDDFDRESYPAKSKIFYIMCYV
jgi:hypothetical protein